MAKVVSGKLGPVGAHKVFVGKGAGVAKKPVIKSAGPSHGGK